MTRLRKMMLEELERRNYSEGTTRRYLRFVERFAQHFGKSPDKLARISHIPVVDCDYSRQEKCWKRPSFHGITSLSRRS